MKPQISPRDLKYLSLYLDKLLTPVEQQRLEKRLQESKPLQQALDELRETRRVLRAMPKARAPMNFTLTPQMVGNRPPRQAYPVWGFVSAMASFLFILVLAGDLLGIFTNQSRSAALPQVSQYEAAAPALENAQEKSVQAVVTSTHTPLLKETPAAFASPSQGTQAEGGADETAALPLAESYAKEAPATSLGIGEDLASGGAVTPTGIFELELLPMETPTGQPVTETPVSMPEGNAQAMAQTPSATAQEAARAAAPAAVEDTSASDENLAAKTIGESENTDTQNQERQVIGAEETGNRDRVSADISPGQWILWIFEAVFALTALISGAIAISRRRKLA